MPTRARKTKRKPAWLAKFSPKGGGRRYQSPGLSGKDTRRVGGRVFRRVSTHTRKVPHPNPRSANRYRRSVGLTATEAGRKSGKRYRVVKQRYYFDAAHRLDIVDSMPMWSLYVENGG